MFGKTISHYKIIEKIGEGGMGEVFLADDLILERKVALKFLPHYLTKNKGNIVRFEREAKAAAALNHLNIVTIYDVIEEDDQICIVMEYVKGKLLTDVINESAQYPLSNTTEIITQIAKGLAKAHRSGIVHRDIKPDNIIIDEENNVKILDFGLAKLKGLNPLTKESSTVGTAQYMSPEQIQGLEIDERSDVWSVGIILYELLTGEMPFQGEYESAIHYAIFNEQPNLPENKNISETLKHVLLKCLQKNLEDRYQNIDQLIDDLNKKRSKTKLINIKSKFSKKKSIHFIFLAILIFLLLGYLFYPDKTLNERFVDTGNWENSVAVLPFDNISNDPQQDYFVDGMTEQIISNLAKLPKLKVISRTSVMHYKDTDKTIPIIGDELHVAYVLEGSVRKIDERIRVTAQLVNTKNDHYVWTENFDREYIELFDIQDEVSKAIAVNLLVNLTGQDMAEIKTNRPQSTQAYEYYLKGRYFHYQKYWGATIQPADFQISEQMFQKAIDLDPAYALSYVNLADLYNTYCRTTLLDEAQYQYYLNKQKINLDKALELDSNLVDVQITKSWILQEEDKISEAFESISKALKLDPNNAYANATMGRFFHSRGLIELAHRFFEKAIETDPLQPMHYSWNGYCLTIQGKYQESEHYLKQALTYDENHFVTVIHYIFLLLTSGKYEQAQMMVEKYDPVYGENTYMMALKSMVLALTGDKEQALYVCPEEHSYNYFIYAVLQMSDKAIDYLITLYNNQWLKREESRYIEFKTNPLLENLRNNPRFQDILAKHYKIYKENLLKYGFIDS